MFDFLKKNNKPQKNVDTSNDSNQGHVSAPGTEIRFNPNLIEKLTSDHQKLLGIFGEINAAFSAANYSLVKTKLQEFKRGFMDHILVENVSLYVYMKNSLDGDDMNMDLVKGFRSEMDEIGKVVRAFIMKYETIGVDEDLAASFGTDLSGIGEALVARIEREEGTLYPLYQPGYN